MQDINYTRIKKDCFWDMNMSKSDMITIVQSNDKRKKKMLFEKILLNSTALFKDLKIFELSDIKYYLENYTIPKFNNQYAFRRKNLAEVYFLDKPLLIDELKWIA